MQKARLVKKVPLAEGTVEFTFERPKGFSYEAGQSIDLTLVNPPETDEEGNMRAFTLASAPHEEGLAIATRLRDTAFKRVLRNLEPGAEVAVAGPFGDFTLHEDGARPAVFIAGGIGVTPFYAMLKDAVKKPSRHPVYLFYANRRPEDAAYLAELAELARQHVCFTFVPTMTGIEKSAEPWSGETGRVDQAMLAKYVPRESAPRYYLAGPQAMALSMRDMLYERGVSRDNIRYKEFSGY